MALSDISSAIKDLKGVLPALELFMIAIKSFLFYIFGKLYFIPSIKEIRKPYLILFALLLILLTIYAIIYFDINTVLKSK